MSRLREINEKLNAYMSNLGGNIDQAILYADWMLINLVRDNIKNKQKNSFDKPITPVYSPFWREKKNLTYPNLFDTGAWQGSFILNAHFPQYEIHSTDWKNAKLMDKYGKNDPLTAISPANKSKAYSITNHAIGQSLKSRVGLT